MLYTNPTLLFLSQINQNLEMADLDMIKRSIADLRDKFVPIARLKEGHFIDRIRINLPGEIFESKLQLQHITDSSTLKKYVGFGRANFPGESVFYGSVVSPNARIPRGVAYLETTSIFSNKPMPYSMIEEFTLGRWRILKDIEVVEMIFSDEALKKSAYANMSLKNQLIGIDTHPLKEHFINQGRFFSDEFARSDCSDQPWNYKISSSYANYVWNATTIKGITFPSVKSDYQGQNVALLPEIVESCLKLETVGLFQFKKEGTEQIVDIVKMAKKLGPEEGKFVW